MKQTCLINSRLLNDRVETAGVGEKEKHELRFFARQFINSMGPANVAATIPEAMKTALQMRANSYPTRADISRM
ncbi:hypothetical protein [Paraburkholderia sp.]|uniref:hypothetical protein n=1 Tax=Paraburkholderia sp. TaxID=1926495 RepID=UPI00257AA6E1|nr:hypothetical protein [Paraburkholderia sp.]